MVLFFLRNQLSSEYLHLLQTASKRIPARMCSHNIASMSNRIGEQKTLSPPPEVRGMTVLDRDAFQREVEVPTLIVPLDKIKDAVKFLKPCLLKLPKLQPIQEEGNSRKVYLNPELFDEKLLYLKKTLGHLNLDSVFWTKLNIKYENLTSNAIFKAVLPPESTGNVSGFSIVGHIIHLNLKPDLMEYKHLIGQVFLDKYSNIKTVVNKTQVIESEFRNFQMELLAGEPKYDVIVKENGIQYAFDFSKVFWNPRLVREHEEIVVKTNPGDLVYDVFAGVGPFAVPAAKKKCQVYANDLNPDSYHWLQHNAKLNKVTDYLHSYNLDGKVFIQTVVKDGLIDLWNKEGSNCNVHVIMNLPACALEFLESFTGILAGQELSNISEMPTIYCYFFKKKDEQVEDIIGKYLDDQSQQTSKVATVRLVAPNKTMMRVEYKIPRSILFKETDIEPLSKRAKID